MTYRAPVDSTPSEMHEIDCIKRFAEGLLLVESCCKEMDRLEPKRGWKQSGEGFHALRINGIKKARQKPTPRGQLFMDAARVQKSLDTGAAAI